VTWGRPEYYAHGPDIPRALRAIESAQSSATALSDELDGQLVGLARLVVAPGERAPLGGRPEITIASDLHNNVLALPALRRVARGTPLFFPGDLTDRGSPLESQLTRGVLHAGTRFVFVTGNHDSDAEAQELADGGAIVLTERGACCAAGASGRWSCASPGCAWPATAIPSAAGARAGTSSRATCRAPRGEQNLFAEWLAGLQDKVDVVMVHEPALAARASRRCAATRRRTRSSARRATRITRTSRLERDFTCSTAGRSARAGPATSARGRRSAWRG
jgi:hypothetical protein